MASTASPVTVALQENAVFQSEGGGKSPRKPPKMAVLK